MIVFTITNKASEQVYVGSTRTDIDSHWETLLIAAESGVEAKLYDDIRSTGANHFEIAEWGIAEDLGELRELISEAKETFDAISLQGLITKPKAATTHRQSAEQRKAEIALKEQNLQQSIVKLDTPVATSPEDLKALAKQRDAELEARIVRERHETLEMAKVLAKMDARKLSPKKAAAVKKTLSKVSRPTPVTAIVAETPKQPVIHSKPVQEAITKAERPVKTVKVAQVSPSSQTLKAQRIAATIDRYRPQTTKAAKDPDQSTLSSALKQRLAQRVTS